MKKVFFSPLNPPSSYASRGQKPFKSFLVNRGRCITNFKFFLPRIYPSRPAAATKKESHKDTQRDTKKKKWHPFYCACNAIYETFSRMRSKFSCQKNKKLTDSITDYNGFSQVDIYFFVPLKVKILFFWRESLRW